MLTETRDYTLDDAEADVREYAELFLKEESVTVADVVRFFRWLRETLDDIDSDGADNP
jgi:hypothetical protein